MPPRNPLNPVQNGNPVRILLLHGDQILLPATLHYLLYLSSTGKRVCKTRIGILRFHDQYSISLALHKTSLQPNLCGVINITVPLLSKSQPPSQPIRQKFQAGLCISRSNNNCNTFSFHRCRNRRILSSYIRMINSTMEADHFFHWYTSPREIPQSN